MLWLCYHVGFLTTSQHCQKSKKLILAPLSWSFLIRPLLSSVARYMCNIWVCPSPMESEKWPIVVGMPNTLTMRDAGTNLSCPLFTSGIKIEKNWINKLLNSTVLICFSSTPGTSFGLEYFQIYILTTGENGTCYSKQMVFSHQILSVF